MRDRHSGLTNGQLNIYQLCSIIFLTDLIIDDDKKETTFTDGQPSNEKKETVVDMVYEDEINNTLSSEEDKYESKRQEEILNELVKDAYDYVRAKHQNGTSKHVIPSDKVAKGVKFKYTDYTKRQRTIEYIRKGVTYDTNESESTPFTHEELISALRSSHSYLGELSEVIGSVKNKTNTDVNSCIKAVRNNVADDLAALRQDDHEIYDPLKEFTDVYGVDGEKLKSTMETAHVFKRFWGPLDSEQTTITVLHEHLASGDPDGNYIRN